MVRGKEIDDSFIFDDVWEDKRKKEIKSKNIKQVWISMFQWPIPINGLAVNDLTGDGNLEVAGVSDDHFLKIFDHEGKELWNKDLYDGLSFVRIKKITSQTDNDVIVGGADKKLHVFDKNGNEIWNKLSKKWWYNAKIFDINNDGENEVIAGCRDRFLYVLKGKTGEEIWKHKFDAYIKFLDVNDNLIAAAADDGILKIFDDKGNEIYTDELNEIIIYCEFVKVQDTLFLGVASGEGEFKIYNVNEKKIVLEKDLDDKITSFKITNLLSNELNIIYGDRNAKLYLMKLNGEKIWEISTNEENYCIAIGDIHAKGVNDIVIGGMDSVLRILSAKDGTIRSFYHLDNFVTNIILADIDKDNELEIITSGRDRTIRVFKEEV